MSQFVATTTLSLMRSLGSTAERSVHRMQAILGREFPNGIGLELAEPVPRKDGSGIDWYTEREEALVRLNDLPDETAAIYRARLRQSVQAVLRAAAAQDSRGDAAARSTATALRNAVTFPGDENVWISGGSGRGDGMLVLTAWGYERHDAETSGKGEISGKTDKLLPVAPPPLPVPPAPRSWGWLTGSLLWLIPVALAGAIAWLLLPACGVALPFGLTAFGKGGGAYCALVAPQPTVDQASLRTQELMAEAAVLEEQLRRHLNSCVPPPKSDLSKDMDKKVNGGGGKTGKLQVTLSWHTLDDLDLNSFCPGGKLGGNQSVKGPSCGDGMKDIDSNKNLTENVRSDPVENLVWKENIAPGSYKFEVLAYVTTVGDRDVTVPFDLRFRLDGQEVICPGTVTHYKNGGGIGQALFWNSGDPLPSCNLIPQKLSSCSANSCKR
ncbi:hypothetical protein [Mesorhizobium sp. M1B.F.Ca.ET.045.04.1.1]|uniref:hypothetical protein n=1 Tax=Mesorhizobium sp. M1B.F.Ca.ET.045.04.1.1 TaxID=2493673 RepID=UPI000F764CA8|nr:hypothetical protein [Mesorhizobium sp. M1B.F.Ca.ET.045.04.1.1]AZO32414.1 hypothetical protein EJ071_37110 [Mesorhizobium sp. M1B.F.Ca.ET.045.04.1.1]